MFFGTTRGRQLPDWLFAPASRDAGARGGGGGARGRGAGGLVKRCGYTRRQGAFRAGGGGEVMKASDIPMKALDIPDTLDPWPSAQEDSGQAGFVVCVCVPFELQYFRALSNVVQ